MGALKAAALLLLASLALLPAASPQPLYDPNLVGDLLRPQLENATQILLPPTENETAQDLSGEDIRIAVQLDVRNVDYQIVGILFGGGKVAADATAKMHLEFRGLSVGRLDDAIRAATGDANASLNSTFGVPTGRLAITAEEVRIIGAGALLAYMQEYEAAAAKSFLQDTLPGLTVLDLQLKWSNTAPFSYVTQAEAPGVPEFDPTQPGTLITAIAIPPLREPPLVLEAEARLNYLTRLALFEIITKPEPDVSTPEGQKELAKEQLKERLQKEQGDRFVDRSAFNLMGFGQLVNLTVPPGWFIDIDVTVPKGFTVEGATDELVLADDHRGAGMGLDGLGRTQAANPAALATLSNRFLVTTVALVGVLLIGLVLRLPLEAGILAVHHKVHARRLARQTGEPAVGYKRAKA